MAWRRGWKGEAEEAVRIKEGFVSRSVSSKAQRKKGSDNCMLWVGRKEGRIIDSIVQEPLRETIAMREQIRYR